MERKLITFQDTQQIVRFVNLANKLDFDVDVKCGSRVVDGKSILGVMSLASSRAVEIVFHSVTDFDLRADELLETAS